MTICTVCCEKNLDRAKFCLECGAPLVAPARTAAEERKVVTALFCDFAGFTESSEAADPEDVNVMLAAYSRMAREQIESHGGVLEKFTLSSPTWTASLKTRRRKIAS